MTAYLTSVHKWILKARL